MILLDGLLKGLDCEIKGERKGLMVARIIDDSRIARKGDLFAAIKGTAIDSHAFVKETAARGAVAVLIEKDVDAGNAVKVRVKDTRAALGMVAGKFYGDPSKDINVIGITGTNGKTTVSYMIEAILKAAGMGCGVMGTIEYRTGDEVIEAPNTTPSPIMIQEALRKMIVNSLTHCAMEVSSHALDQKRTAGIRFDRAIFTNLSREHLDYHKDMDGYLEAKLKLFKGLSAGGAAIINMEDPNFKEVANASSGKSIMTYGLTGKPDVKASRRRNTPEGSEFDLSIGEDNVRIASKTIGEHNVANMLAAAACAASYGIEIAVIKKALEDFRPVSGRLEPVCGSAPFKIYIDYAHTDDALEKALTALSALKEKRIITVFGCGGDRDKSKRPRMGKVASRFSDIIIVTSDNPRSEDQEDIIKDILKGVDKHVEVKAMADRREAIREAIALAKEKDIVLIAGKGHEKCQIIGDERIPFNDMEVAKEFLGAACLK